MGGRGSGNCFKGSSKATTERHYRIDIRWLKKHGYLQPGIYSFLPWPSNGKQNGFIKFRIKADSMILNYRFHINVGQWEDLEEHIPFDRTPCNYGGYRKWFLCPHCRKRVAVLYGAGKHFLCRHCYNLTYASQREDWGRRTFRKGRKIRKRLGVPPGELMLFKPKYMHQQTFDELRLQALEYEHAAWNDFGRKLGIDV